MPTVAPAIKASLEARGTQQGYDDDDDCEARVSELGYDDDECEARVSELGYDECRDFAPNRDDVR
jgi:hypothetical protein